MNISGIRASVGFYEYNDIKSSELRSQQIQDAQKIEEESERLAVQEVSSEAMESQQNFTAFDFAKQYEPNATYEMKGAESDLAMLDVEKLLSDVKKDAVLQQYQFFVGEKKAQMQGRTEGNPDMIENFVL